MAFDLPHIYDLRVLAAQRAAPPPRRQMVISWTTRDAGSPVVQWTADATTLPFFPNSALGSTTTYTPADLCGGLDQKLGYFDPGSLQSALMTGLAPATRYWYRVGDTARPRV